MNERYEKQLERVIDRELRQLPALEAPEGFAEKVLAEALRRQAMPWWRKAFPDWPKAAQVFFILLATTSLYLLTQAGRLDAVDRSVQALEPAAAFFNACWSGAYSLISTCATSVERLSPMLLIPVFASLLALGLSAFGALTTLQRIRSHEQI